MNDVAFFWSILVGFLIAGYVSSLIIKINSVLFAIIMLVGLFIVFLSLDLYREREKDKNTSHEIYTMDSNGNKRVVFRIGHVK